MGLNLKEKYGKTALIAGASEGIGAAFAKMLAAEGIDLVLVARRLQPLEKVADMLERNYNVKVTCINCDLSEMDAAEQIAARLEGREIDILVYNAALSYIGHFEKNPVENHSLAAQVNMITPLKMVHLHGGKMVEKGKGAVILMSSMAGLQGSGYLAVYAATKAFNRVLAESLWYEWKNYGVDVIACVAGATSTPGFISSNPEKNLAFAPRVLYPEEVAEECLRKLGKQPSFITGRSNRIASFIMRRIFPGKTAVNIMGDNTKKMYRL